MTVIDIKDMIQDQSTIIEQDLRQIAGVFGLSTQLFVITNQEYTENRTPNNLSASATCAVNHRLI